MSSEDTEWKLLDKRLRASYDVIKAGHRGKQESTPESNSKDAECTLEDCANKMLQHLAEYIKNGGKL